MVTTQASAPAFASCDVFTCGLGPGEDELGGAAALHLPVAGVDVDAVNGEGLEAGDLQLALRHRLLGEVKLSVRRHAAAVAVRLRRGDGAAVEGEPAGAPAGGVGHADDIPPPPIGRPGQQRWGGEVGG